MADEKNIMNYTAADIEKYWKGKLSPAEMHAMEKAAMDDPFFADALEGYQYANTSGNDLTVLKEKLNKRTAATAVVIPIKQKKFNWLRVAAAIIIIGGAGVLVQQLFFNNNREPQIGSVPKENEKKSDIATNNKPAATDTSKPLVTNPGSLTYKTDTKPTSTEIVTSNLSATIDTFRSYNYNSTIVDNKKTTEDIKAQSSPAIVKEEKKGDDVKDKSTFGKVAADSVVLADKISDRDARAKNAEAFYDREKNNAINLANKYNYRVVDAQNNPVPFANVMNTRDNVGTYTDIRGNFNLLSSDSIMDVQIRSQGFVANNYRLMPSTQHGALVLKEDENTRKQITQVNRQLVASVTRKDSTEIEEPEVGWGNYNTYVQNNIQIPENIRGKKTSTDVELSFDVDKNGQPINIKVTRSSQCKECDEEAKRLLKEGPKWKRKGKKSKTTITIAIDQ